MKFIKSVAVGACCALAAFVATPASAQTARPTDSAVEKLMEDAQKSVKQFEKSLDSDFKRSTVRGAKAEVDVENFLKDFKTEIERMRERFEPQYSASSEVTAVLFKATQLDTYMKTQPPAFKGRSEWDVAAAGLVTLAAAYGTRFPAPANAVARRINDKEVEQAAELISKEAGPYKKEIDDAFPKEEAAALSAAQQNVEDLGKAAKSLKSRSESGKPASGEAGMVAEKFAAVNTALAGKTLSEKATARWARISAAAQTVAQAFRPGGA